MPLISLREVGGSPLDVRFGTVGPRFLVIDLGVALTAGFVATTLLIRLDEDVALDGDCGSTCVRADVGGRVAAGLVFVLSQGRSQRRIRRMRR